MIDKLNNRHESVVQILTYDTNLEVDYGVIFCTSVVLNFTNEELKENKSKYYKLVDIKRFILVSTLKSLFNSSIDCLEVNNLLKNQKELLPNIFCEYVSGFNSAEEFVEEMFLTIKDFLEDDDEVLLTSTLRKGFIVIPLRLSDTKDLVITITAIQ